MLKHILRAAIIAAVIFIAVSFLLGWMGLHPRLAGAIAAGIAGGAAAIPKPPNWKKRIAD